MKNVGQQVTKVEVCNDQATGSNEHKGVIKIVNINVRLRNPRCVQKV